MLVWVLNPFAYGWLPMGVVVVVGLNLYDCRGGEFGVNGGEDRVVSGRFGLEVVVNIGSGCVCGWWIWFWWWLWFYCRDGAKTKN